MVGDGAASPPPALPFPLISWKLLSWGTSELGSSEHYTSGIRDKDLRLYIQILVPIPLPLLRPLHQCVIQHGQKPVPKPSMPIHTLSPPLQDERTKLSAQRKAENASPKEKKQQSCSGTIK